MVYEHCKIYGPYVWRDGRKRVVIVFPDNVKTVISYAKYLMEVHLDRYLDPNLETVDHKDSDFTNDVIDNFQLKTRSEHSSLEVPRIKEQLFVCSLCKNSFILSGRKLNDAFQNRLRGHTGPFCSRSCAGKATHLSRNDPRVVVHNIKREKYTLKNPDIIFNVSNSNDYL